MQIDQQPGPLSTHLTAARELLDLDGKARSEETCNLLYNALESCPVCAYTCGAASHGAGLARALLALVEAVEFAGSSGWHAVEILEKAESLLAEREASRDA